MYLIIPGDKGSQGASADDTERQIAFSRLCKANRDPIPSSFAGSLSNAAMKIKRSYAKSPRVCAYLPSDARVSISPSRSFCSAWLMMQEYMYMLNVLAQTSASRDVPFGCPIGELLMDGEPMQYGAKGASRLKGGGFIFYLDAYRPRINVSHLTDPAPGMSYGHKCEG